jgi:hypothetical protein
MGYRVGFEGVCDKSRTALSNYRTILYQIMGKRRVPLRSLTLRIPTAASSLDDDDEKPVWPT